MYIYSINIKPNFMSNYDYLVLGEGNLLHPANQEVDTKELTVDQALEDVKENMNSDVSTTIEDHIYDLEYKLKCTLERFKDLKTQLKRLAEIEQSMKTFGNLTHEEKTEKNSILDKHQ
jgi:hypothetical protein